jgi:hypothetical protein
MSEASIQQLASPCKAGASAKDGLETAKDGLDYGGSKRAEESFRMPTRIYLFLFPISSIIMMTSKTFIGQWAEFSSCNLRSARYSWLRREQEGRGVLQDAHQNTPVSVCTVFVYCVRE